jgi:hypothetical protein
VLWRLVWEPLAQHLPVGTHTVYVAPDGPLTGLPWAALPGPKPGKVLLEAYALAVVPHGRFLGEQLQSSRARPPAAQGMLLAVGDVSYDQPAQAVAVHPDRPGGLRAAERAGAKLSWPALAATARELGPRRPHHARCGQFARLAGLIRSPRPLP